MIQFISREQLKEIRMSQKKNAQSVEDAVPAVSVASVSSVAVVVVVTAAVVVVTVVVVVVVVVVAAVVVSFAIDSGQSIPLSTVFHLPH